MPELISVNNLSRNYGDFCAVDDISFELAAGDILGFLGPNGAGKSSTMQMLTGNLAPTLGEIRINGIDLLDQPKAAKSNLGYLPETPPLYKDMSVNEYLQYCGQLHLLKNKALSEACDTALERCGLLDVRQRLIRNLSKGYQQRVGIAQAILHSPPVIILDEPTVGLDPIQIIEIRDLIKQLGESHGIILCTHILPEVQAVCNRVQIINQGKLVYSADMDAILNSNNNRHEVQVNNAAALQADDSFISIQRMREDTFLIESEMNAEQLCEYLVTKQYGLNRFCEHRTSLEQIFIELTLTDNAADNSADMDDAA